MYSRLASTLLFSVSVFAASNAKVKITMVSFGDDIENKTWMGVSNYKQRYHTKASIEESLLKIKQHGFSTVYWRMLWEGAPDSEIEKYSYRVQEETAHLRHEFDNTPWAWDPHELRWPIEVAHKLGLKLYAWIVPYNMGAPPGAHVEAGIGPSTVGYPAATIIETQFPWMFKFAHEHPEYQLIDREGKRHHYGVMEWAYPEARQYWVRLVQNIVERYNVDGVYMDTRTECMAPQYADQFGFNDPVVDEYQRRYGVNIRKEDFDLEKWRQLRGEYLTLLIQELSAVIHSSGKSFSFGTARGEYIGFPLGNLKLEWRKWVAQKLIDELHLDERGWAWGTHGYGYLADPETERGLEPVEDMVRNQYGPLCRQHGVKLYFKPRQYANKDAAWKARVAALPEFDGLIESPDYK